MKQLKEIENLSIQEMERIASDESIPVPPTLKRDITVTARALEMAGLSQTNKRDKKAAIRRMALFSYPAAAVAVIAIGLNLTFRNNVTDSIADTFDNPMTAYIQMEQVMSFISEKMNSGYEIANIADPVVAKTINALK